VRAHLRPQRSLADSPRVDHIMSRERPRKQTAVSQYVPLWKHRRRAISPPTPRPSRTLSQTSDCAPPPSSPPTCSDSAPQVADCAALHAPRATPARLRDLRPADPEPALRCAADAPRARVRTCAGRANLAPLQLKPSGTLRCRSPAQRTTRSHSARGYRRTRPQSHRTIPRRRFASSWSIVDKPSRTCSGRQDGPGRNLTVLPRSASPTSAHFVPDGRSNTGHVREPPIEQPGRVSSYCELTLQSQSRRFRKSRTNSGPGRTTPSSLSTTSCGSFAMASSTLLQSAMSLKSTV
jgi:hypothetical protein